MSNTEDLYSGNRYSKPYNPRFRGNDRYNTNNKDNGNQSNPLRKVNSRNKDGKITKYNI